MLIIILAGCFKNKCLVQGYLKKGKEINSVNGNYKLILQQSGNLEILCRGKSIWSSNTTSSDIDVFQFQLDRNLVVRRKNGTYAWESMTVHDNGGFYSWEPRENRLVMQDDGDLVLYADDEVRWRTGTSGKCPEGKL